MRFSLKTLVVLVALAGVGTSVFLQVAKIRQLRHQTNETQVQLRSAVSDDWRKQRSQEVLEPRLRSLQAEHSRVLAVRERVEQTFDSLVPEFSKVVPKPDQISVREVPRLKKESGLEKHFVVYVPAGVSCQLKLNITGDVKQARPVNEDYLLPETDSLPLAVGFNRVWFSFGQIEQRYKAQVGIGDSQPLEIELFHAESHGHSYSLYNFRNQKDYRIGSKLPKLVSFKPNPCDNKIELILVEQAAVDSGEQL